MSLESQIDFNFPFKPYEVQESFMLQLYQTLNEGKVGIFESPTGTGKSLSIICGSLTWLRNFKDNQKKLLQAEINELEQKPDNQDDWFAAHNEKIENQNKLQGSKEKLSLLKEEEQRIEQLKNNPSKKRKREDLQFRELVRSAKKFQDINDEDQTEGYISDSDFLPLEFHNTKEDCFSEDEDKDEVDKNTLKIFYCSRTHSQLAQFVREIQKSPFGKDARVISLGSRKNLCINETVNNLNNLSLINEKCTELQKNKKKTEKGLLENKSQKLKRKSTCPYYKHYSMNDLKDHSLIEVQDIEQIVESGKNLKACPYYSMRLGVTDAEIIVLPYNILLQKAMRESSGINLKDNIIIIDEAHNLLETIGNIHSVVLSGLQISACYNQLTHYLERFKTRLNAFNLLCIKQVLSILAAFIKILGGTTKSTTTAKLSKDQQSRKIYSLVEFLTTTDIDNFNFFNILQYCRKSLIAHKLNGFSSMQYSSNVQIKTEKKTALASFLENIKPKDKTSQEPEIESSTETFSSTASFTSIQEFLACLTNSNQDGRIIVDRQETLKTSSLKFLLLNPAIYFLDVIREARSVILAGGTMHPLTDFTETLFKTAGLSPENITLFSCGHVIPKDHLLPLVLESGPTNVRFDFTYKNRNNKNLIGELGRLIINTCSVTPGGIILFFPSYDYEQIIYSNWEKSGVISRLNSKKRVFREPRLSSQTDQVLRDYSEAIARKCNGQNGAILLSIVGGKMSEGINFSNELGRLVIMIGLPYPNIESPELKERMKYLVSLGRNGNQLPETLCMRAVNQSIGRAIRHSQDYAAILLLDERYRKNWVQTALPKWISTQLQCFDKFGSMFGALRNFYNTKKV